MSRTTRPLSMWSVHDSDGYDDFERNAMLIVANSKRQALYLWRESLGIGRHEADPVAVRAVWEWADLPAPVLPTAPGVWDGRELTARGEAFRGYGYSLEDDPYCDSCGVRFWPVSAVELAATATLHAATVCPDCAADVLAAPVEFAS